MKTGRNKQCHCGSGKKYKRCHGWLGATPAPAPQAGAPFLIYKEQQEAQERFRQAQQGRGKPIISARFKGTQMVAVGNRIYQSPKWKTFADFLRYYLNSKLGSEWIKAELNKPVAQRHTIMQWSEALFQLRNNVIKSAEEPVSMEVNGVLACFFGLAYSLYLLDHNVELQDRLIARLKNQSNFQGAYYEALVARALINAGFDLTLEDEADGLTKHCEFAAVSKDTGQKFWIEAKMRGVAGLLGKTDKDGASARTAGKATSMLISHLNSALQKPAADQRMIFIDLNAEMAADTDDDNRPAFAKEATARLQRYERENLEAGQAAYVFVTNMTFHRDLLGPAQMLTIPTGLGIPDFNRSGRLKLSEVYRRDKKHADAFRVATSLSKLLTIPTTFDGQMPATVLHGDLPPVQIGKKYCFEGAAPDGADLEATVADATVMENEKAAYVAVNVAGNQSYILKQPMSDHQLADYHDHKDSYFGKVKRVSEGVSTPYDLFRFFVDAYSAMTRMQLLEKMKIADRDARELSDEDLLLSYCERLVAASGMFDSVDGVLMPKAVKPEA